MITTSASAPAYLVDTDPALLNALAGSDFADAFRITLTEEQARLSAGELTEQMFSRTPEWISLLLSIRNRAVRPFGLKAGNMRLDDASRSAAGFPVVTQSDEQVQLGFDDKHLDFRLWVRRDGATSSTPAQLTLTTVVRTHQLLGRVYLGVIKPFHRCIAPAMLNRLRS
jgi:hypothetical protein